MRAALEGFMLPYSIGRVTENWRPEKRAKGKRSGKARERQHGNSHSGPPLPLRSAEEHIHDTYYFRKNTTILKQFFVEGASGNVDTSWLTGLADKALKQKISDSLLRQGRLTGSEYYSVVQKKPAAIKGIENEALYAENALRLKEIIERRPALNRILNSIDAKVSQLKEIYYSPRLKRLEKAIVKKQERRNRQRKVL